MNKVLILGAGKIGSTIAKWLNGTGGYDVLIADLDQKALDRLPNLKTALLKPDNLEPLFEGRSALISALPYSENDKAMQWALHFKTSYFDLSEDVENTAKCKNYASAYATDGQIFMPQCGLAPGFIGILGASLIRKFDWVESVKMRVGALPRHVSTALKYNLSWSTAGLINEYCNDSEAIVNRKLVRLPSLDGMEHFSVDGVEYEAFHTSGGLGTLCETFKNKVRNMDYKTARYPGHRDLMHFLIHGLGFIKRRQELEYLFNREVPLTKQDQVLVYCSAIGQKDGQLIELTDVRKINHRVMFGEDWSAIQLTTAAGMCTAVDLHFSGKLPSKGFVRQEDIKLEDFLANRFGSIYSDFNEVA